MRERARHITDDRLVESYYAGRHGETIDPRIADHVAACRACGDRFADVARVLDDVRTEGTAESDAMFTADRLRAQWQQVLRRLEHAGRPARVIAFPRQAAGRVAAVPRTASRWVAAAAAAGLFVGVAVGASYQWETHTRPRADRGRLTAAARLTPVATRGMEPASVAADDAFLSELDAALQRPRTRALIAYDALTPHVREVRDQQ
jgi:hypothetical protein